MRTYCQGPRLFTTRNITKSDFIKICDQMGCCPEAITEGGFHYLNTPGYKSLRLRANPNRWPWIDEEKVVSEWRDNNDILLDANLTFSCFLKAFSGAPAYTYEELLNWKTAFESVGIKMDLSYCGISVPKEHRPTKKEFHKQLTKRKSMINAYLHNLSLDQLQIVEELCEKLNSAPTL